MTFTREAAGFANGRFGNDEQAAHAFFRSDGKIGKDYQIRDALVFDGRNDGDIGGASA